MSAKKSSPKKTRSSRRQQPLADPRKVKYVRERVVNGKSKRAAALSAGFTESMANRAGDKIENDPLVTEALRNAMDAQGLNIEKIAKRLNEAADAMETKLVTYRGKVKEQVHLVDHKMRTHAVETASKIFGVRGLSSNVAIEDNKGKSRVVVLIDC